MCKSMATSQIILSRDAVEFETLNGLGRGSGGDTTHTNLVHGPSNHAMHQRKSYYYRISLFALVKIYLYFVRIRQVIHSILCELTP